MAQYIWFDIFLPLISLAEVCEKKLKNFKEYDIISVFSAYFEVPIFERKSLIVYFHAFLQNAAIVNYMALKC